MTQPTVDSVRATVKAAVAAQGAVVAAAKAAADELHAARAAANAPTPPQLETPPPAGQ